MEPNKANRLAILLTTVFFLVRLTAFAQQETPNRFALVIGVQNYVSVPALRHSLNDAADMASVLKSKGFKVDALYDPKSKKEIRDAVTRYYNLMRNQTGAVGIIYYAGHGTQYEGENYLIPASANLQIPGDMDEQCVKMNSFMSVLNSSNNNLNIFLIDACRTNSFPSFSRDIVKGLSAVEAPKGSIVVFATQPGTTASDGTGKNGLFTSKLLKYINEPNLNVGEVFRKVKQDVNADSEGKQLPSVVDNSIGGDFYFSKDESSKKVQPVLQPPIISEVVNYTQATTKVLLDYGYGPSDAATVTVGPQEWISKNLNVSTFANGDAIPEAKTAKEWKRAGEEKKPGWCYYNNDPANGRIYGKLYNWYAVNDPRGLAPKGWHIPSDAEWTALTDYLGGQNVAGLSMKSARGRLENGNGNDHSGIAGLPGGGRGGNGSFYFIGKYGYWWSSSGSSADNAWGRAVGYGAGSVGRDGSNEEDGFSVRCLRD